MFFFDEMLQVFIFPDTPQRAKGKTLQGKTKEKTAEHCKCLFSSLLKDQWKADGVKGHLHTTFGGNAVHLWQG